MTVEVRQKLLDAVLCVAVFLTAFFYRFNTLGGALGGFSNDEFGYLARARQIQAGDVPFRDFTDPGWFLTDYLAAAAQWIGGYTLRSEALLTVGMLSIAAALTFLLARRAARSYLAALAATAIQIALEPRHYNYPKLVLYAAAIAVAWAYVDKPTRPRLAGLGGITGIGFLFRHDHLLYLGLLTLVTVAIVHRAAIREALRGAAAAAAVATLFVVPFLGFLAVNGGVGEYFRQALVYVQRDAERTSFSFPRFSYDPSRPLVAFRRGASPSDDVRINVRWNGVSDEQRRMLEARYSLSAGTSPDGTTWTYQLQDVSRANVESLVRDPLVEDTHGIDRSSLDVSSRQPLRLETQFDSLENATAVLYYGCLALPVLVAIVLYRVARSRERVDPMVSLPHLIPVIVLGAVLAVGFLSRGSTNIRIPDVGVTSAVFLAWLLAIVLGRGARVITTSMPARLALRTAAIAALCVTVLSVNGLARVSDSVRNAGFTRGPLQVIGQASMAGNALSASPSVFAEDEEQPRLLRLAGYVRACTAPGDRLFALGHYPELYYFSDRPFAGGHAWLLPLYYSEDEDEARIVARLKDARVPIVVTENRATYESDYRSVFEQVDRYLASEYVDAGDVDVGSAAPLRVLVRKDLQPAGRYEPLGLPCFASPEARAAR